MDNQSGSDTLRKSTSKRQLVNPQNLDLKIVTSPSPRSARLQTKELTPEKSEKATINAQQSEFQSSSMILMPADPFLELDLQEEKIQLYRETFSK